MRFTWAEPFAGAAACALHLVGEGRLVPPVAWMGGKRRYAAAICEAMGVPAGAPGRVLLADAGPWGWVWRLLVAPNSAARVAGVLRSWSGEHPRDLWQRLAALPPAEALHERAAQWLWLQARSASGVPIWWEGWRLTVGNGKRPTDRGEDLRWPGHQAERERWVASDGRGVPRPPGFNAGQAKRNERRGWRFAGRPDRRQEDRPAVMSGEKALAGWRMGEERKKARRGTRTASQSHTGGWWQADHATGRFMPAGQSGRGDRGCGRTGCMVNPATIADRIEAIARAFAGVPGLAVLHGDAARLLPRPGFAYLDPPYLGATGYGWSIARESLLALALRWADAGAVTAVSEAEPLDLPGWRHINLTRAGGKPEWLTVSPRRTA